MLSKIFLSHLVLILIFVGADLSAIAQDSVNEDPETKSQESNSPPISTSAATLGGPSSVDSELAEDAREKDSVFEGIDRALKPWFEFKERVNEDIGLQFGLDYSILYQGLTDSLGEDQAAGGVFRVFGNWTLLGRNSSSPGSLVFKDQVTTELFYRR